MAFIAGKPIVGKVITDNKPKGSSASPGSTQWKQEQNAQAAKGSESAGSTVVSGSPSLGGGGSSSSGFTKYTGGNAALDSALKQYGDTYNAARDSGDWQGMQAANEKANQLRNQYGYAAESAYDDIMLIRGQYGGGESLAGGQAGQGAPQYPYQYQGPSDMWNDIYAKQSAAEQAAVDAYIQQQVNSLNGQKAGVTQSADEAARQAYISYMQSQSALPQALAASGYSGGMADSHRLALDTTLQNNQQQIIQNRDTALNDIDTAINNAKLEGSIQGAQAQAALGRDAISAYQNYIQQQNAYANQDFWTKYGYDFQGGQAQLDRDFQSGQAQLNRDWQSEEGKAQALAAVGNFSGYAKLWGLSDEETNALVDGYAQQKRLTETQAARDLAAWYAQYGDFSKLADLGVNIDYLKRNQEMEFLPKGSTGGGGGYGGGNGGGDAGGGLLSATPSAGYQTTYNVMHRNGAAVQDHQGQDEARLWVANYLDLQLRDGKITDAEYQALVNEALKMFGMA